MTNSGRSFAWVPARSRNSGTAHNSKQPIWPSRNLLALMIVCAFLLAGCTAQTNQTPGSNTFSSWAAEAALAKAEAAKIDKEASAWEITTYPVSCSSANAQAINTDFVFIRPTGESILVTVSDTEPPTLIAVNPRFDQGGPVGGEELGRLATALSPVTIPPREACQTTVKKAEATLGVSGPSPTIAMFLTRDSRSEYGVSAVWEVTYRELGTAGLQVLGFDVSGENGEILKSYPPGLSSGFSTPHP